MMIMDEAEEVGYTPETANLTGNYNVKLTFSHGTYGPMGPMKAHGAPGAHGGPWEPMGSIWTI